MGNRAVVHFKDDDSKHGIYLHWNGGPESILAFLDTMESRGWTRIDYASARFTAVVGEFFDNSGDDSGHSLGIVDDPAAWADGCDNGLYEVTRGNAKWVVKHRGKPLTLSKLKGEARKQYDGMVEMLAKLRALRTPAKKTG